MKNLKTYLVISIVVNILLCWVIFKPMPKKTDIETYLIDKFKAENIAKKQKVIADSIRHEAAIEKLNKNVYYVQKQRKNERNKYELELAKISNMASDSVINLYLDSLQKVCCPKRTSR
jgi:hypothetical protein